MCKECPNRIEPELWQQAIDDDLRELLRQGQYDSAKDRLISSLKIDEPLKDRAQSAEDAGDL